MQEQVPALLSAVVGDGFGAAGWLMGNLAGTEFAAAAQGLLRRRAERARDILVEEIRRGERPLGTSEIDEAAALLLRYSRAAHEGASCLNLRLMAKVIARQAHRGALYADEFLRHANTIASLRREEIIVFGTLQRHWTTDAVQALADDHDRIGEVDRLMIAELIPMPFVGVAELTATENAVVRTGFLSRAEALSGPVFKPTRHFEQLFNLASIDAALEVEPA